MEANLHSFVDDRAVHGVAREMRQKLMKDMKKMIDDDTEKEIQKALKDVPYTKRSSAKSDYKSEF